MSLRSIHCSLSTKSSTTLKFFIIINGLKNRLSTYSAEIKFDNPNTQGDSLYSIVLERRKGLFKKLFD